MNDLIKFRDIIDKIIIFSFNDLTSEEYLKNKFKRNFKKVIIIKSQNNLRLENRIQHLSSFNSHLIDKSKYLWFMSDKDRILIKNCNSIKMLLKKNINGLTMNTRSLNKISKEKKISDKFIYFNLEKGIHKLGLISSQILKKGLFTKYSKKTELSAYYLSEIILKIIINEKKWFFCTKKIIGYTHLNKDININKLSLKYIHYRVEQEIIFYIYKLHKILSISNYPDKEKIIQKAFFKNVISWLILLKKMEKKIIFSNKIKKLNKSIIRNKFIKFIIFLLIYTPYFIINLLKEIKKFILK